MVTIGVDFAKRSSVYCVLDEKGQRVRRVKLENDPVLMRRFLLEIPGPKRLALEAGRSWGLFYETVKDTVDDFHLAHPAKMRVVTRSETKNDYLDADWIAKLTHAGLLPEAYVPDEQIRQLRSLVRMRSFLVRQRTAVKNQVQTLLDRNLWPVERPKSFKSPFCQKGLSWLRSLSLPEKERFLLDECLASYDFLCQRIGRLESAIGSFAVELPGMNYLRTVPGLAKSRVHAYTILLEIADIGRFQKARNLAHYAGLIPRERSSGDNRRTGSLIKGANSHLRLALIESLFPALMKDRALRDYYQTVKARAGSSAAIIATTRKLSHAIYHVLKQQRAFKPFTPAAASGPSAETEE